MEPRNESQKTPEPRTEERKSRFRIDKLEERIAPCSYWYRGPLGRKVHVRYPGPCGGK